MTPDTFLTDGINKTFPTTKKFKSGSTYLFLNGIYQGLVRDYTEDAGNESITFKNIPADGLEGEIRYSEYDEAQTAVSGVSSFKDQLAVDALNVFLNLDEFAETITYTPKSGVGVLMRAIIDRSQSSPAGEETGRLLKNQAKVSIANHGVYGMTTIIKGADTVSLPERIGGASFVYIVEEILSQDEGMWQLLLQK